MPSTALEVAGAQLAARGLLCLLDWVGRHLKMSLKPRFGLGLLQLYGFPLLLLAYLAGRDFWKIWSLVFLVEVLSGFEYLLGAQVLLRAEIFVPSGLFFPVEFRVPVALWALVALWVLVAL